MIKDHLDNERKPVAATTWATFSISRRDLLNASSQKQSWCTGWNEK